MKSAFETGDMVRKPGDKREWTIIEFRNWPSGRIEAVLLRFRNTSAGFRPVTSVCGVEAVRPAFTYRIHPPK